MSQWGTEDKDADIGRHKAFSDRSLRILVRCWTLVFARVRIVLSCIFEGYASNMILEAMKVISASRETWWSFPDRINLDKWWTKSGSTSLPFRLANMKSNGRLIEAAVWVTVMRKNRVVCSAEYRQPRICRAWRISFISLQRSSLSRRKRARGDSCSAARWSTLIEEKNSFRDLLWRLCWRSSILRRS